ncbi:fimbrial protein [Dysgonomonas capnocytophagoides]|uniref:fimbrial protein n=1 Tax=Dysgonomonas capnocytophagoides TaxID=45254 RepID=UPI003341859E
MKSLYNIIGAILIFTGIISCKDDHATYNSNPTEGLQEVTFKVILPQYTSPDVPKLRSMGAGEQEIKSLDVLVFDVDGSGSETLTYKYSVRSADISQSGNTVTFKSWLKATNSYNVAIVANASEVKNNGSVQLSNVIAGFTEGMTKTAILSALNVRNTSGWLSDYSNSYTAIPMYGEIKNPTVTSGTISNILLKRMLARIDVEVDTNVTDFILEKVHLCNYNTVGMVTPLKNISPLDEVNMSPATVPNIELPGSPQTGVSDAIIYSGNAVVQDIYTFESAAASDNNETSRQNATCLIIEGKYKGQTYFYRVDFTYDNSTSNLSNYMPLLRNYKYEVKIINAAGIGYDSANEAFNSYSVISNLKTRIISYDEGEMKDINYNGQYYLAMSDDGVLVEKSGVFLDETGTGYYPSEFTVQTDYPDGIDLSSITVTDQEGSGSTVNWINGLTVSPDFVKGNQKLTINVPVSTMESSEPEDVRVAYINFKAGRLQASFEIIQFKTSLGLTSNCYMVKPGSAPILIPILRAEEGVPGSLSRRNNFEAEYIWTDNANGIGKSGSSVKSAKAYGKSRKALLWVEPGPIEGNTVIAVKNNDDNKIKWSWHMWVTNYEPSGDIMDRNLGALAEGSGTNNNDWWNSHGLFYQWGRKDPFPYFYEKRFDNGTYSQTLIYNANGGTPEKVSFDIFSDLATSVENPILFSRNHDTDSSLRWFGSDGASSWNKNNKKSVYDPSPQGWRVMIDHTRLDAGMFAPNTRTWNTNYLTFQLPYLQTGYDAGRITYSNLDGGFYPGAGGVFFGKNSKEVVHNDTAGIGYYWTATSSGTSMAEVTKMSVGEYTTGYASSRSNAFSIRCIKE